MRIVVLGAAFAALVMTSGCLAIDTARFTTQPKSTVVLADGAVAADAPVAEVAAVPPNGRKPYPGFSGPLRAANVQMNNDEAAELEAKLTALATARKSGSISEAEYQKRATELRRIATDHGAETQAQIAN